METDPTTLVSLLVERAANTPDRPYIVELDGTQLSYAQIADRARLWASAWAALGISAGDLVATIQLNSADSLAGWLGLSSLGAIEVPVNTDYQGALLTHALNLSGAAVIALAAEYAPRLLAVIDQLPKLKTVVLLDSDERIDLPCKVVTRAELFDGVIPAEALRCPKPWEIALISFTSGTTGPSKAVQMPWAQLHASVLGVVPTNDLTADDVFYNPGPSYHVGSRTQSVLTAVVGGRQVIAPAMSIGEMGDIYLRFGITTGMFPPMWIDNPPKNDPRFVFRNAYGAIYFPAFHEMKGSVGVRTNACYGMTEVSVPLRDTGWDMVTYDERGRMSCGKLRQGYPGFEVRIVDENDQPLPAGQVGELVVRSAAPWTINAGYLNMPEKTAQAWRNGWFHTGDAFVSDASGSYYFVDRMGDFLGAHHQNISSAEVEGHIAQHPAVAESAVVLVKPQDEPGAKGDLKAVLLLKAEAKLTPADFVEWLTGRMPDYMVPRYVEIVTELPRTPTMKVRKVQLRTDGITGQSWDRRAVATESV